MPPPEIFERHDAALLWETAGYDAAGRPTRSRYPVEIAVRWENRKARVPGPDGSLLSVDAVIVVDREIAVGSMLWRGSLADYEDDAAGTGTGTLEEAGTGTAEFGGLLPPDGPFYEVAAYAETPDIKGREIRRVVGAVRMAESAAAPEEAA